MDTDYIQTYESQSVTSLETHWGLQATRAKSLQHKHPDKLKEALLLFK